MFDPATIIGVLAFIVVVETALLVACACWRTHDPFELTQEVNRLKADVKHWQGEAAFWKDRCGIVTRSYVKQHDNTN